MSTKVGQVLWEISNIYHIYLYTEIEIYIYMSTYIEKIDICMYIYREKDGYTYYVY